MRGVKGKPQKLWDSFFAQERKKAACKPGMQSIYKILSSSWVRKTIFQNTLKSSVQYKAFHVFISGDVESSVPRLLQLQRWQKFSHKSQFAFSLSAHCREAEEDINIYEEFSARMYQCNNIAWVRVLSIPLLPKWSKSNKYNKLPISPQDYYQTCVHSAFTSVSLFSFLNAYMCLPGPNFWTSWRVANYFHFSKLALYLFIQLNALDIA